MADIETKPMVEIKVRADLVAGVRAVGLDPAEVCEGALAYAAPRRARELKWQDENADAIAAYNAIVEAEGLPLAEFRQF